MGRRTFALEDDSDDVVKQQTQALHATMSALGALTLARDASETPPDGGPYLCAKRDPKGQGQ